MSDERCLPFFNPRKSKKITIAYHTLLDQSKTHTVIKKCQTNVQCVI